MGLVMSMILIERVIEVTIDPGKLRNMSEVEWHLSDFSWNILVVGSKRVHFLIEIGVEDRVTQIVMWLTLMPEVLGHLRMIEVNCSHYVK